MRAADDKPDRTIAITIDDLPAGAANSMTAAEITSMTKQLTDTLRDQKIPVVAFVNERKLYYNWDEVNELITGSYLQTAPRKLAALVKIPD